MPYTILYMLNPTNTTQPSIADTILFLLKASNPKCPRQRAPTTTRTYRINELLSGIWPENKPAGADPNSDYDDGFVDRDDVLSGVQQKSTPASANLNDGSMAKQVDDGTRVADPPILAAPLNHNGEVDNARLRVSADRLESASPAPGSVIYQARKVQVNLDIAQGTLDSNISGPQDSQLDLRSIPTAGPSSGISPLVRLKGGHSPEQVRRRCITRMTGANVRSQEPPSDPPAPGRDKILPPILMDSNQLLQIPRSRQAPSQRQTTRHLCIRREGVVGVLFDEDEKHQFKVESPYHSLDFHEKAHRPLSECFNQHLSSLLSALLSYTQRLYPSPYASASHLLDSLRIILLPTELSPHLLLFSYSPVLDSLSLASAFDNVAPMKLDLRPQAPLALGLDESEGMGVPRQLPL
ncbi:hypothetical protein B7494_g6442 [Chlorociboria aeruginascens]|nr:hypothetical protein B7494_g6442 [Chlorociboria aeruginascens]